MKRSDCLAVRTLLEAARQRKGNAAELCRVVFEHLDTTSVLHAAIHQALAPFQLSELQFAVLVVLHSLDPEPVSAADLATYTAVSRSAMTEAIDHLEQLQLVSRARDERDRRILRMTLTPGGRTTAEPATRAFLQSLTTATRYIDTATRASLLGGYALLQAGAGPRTP